VIVAKVIFTALACGVIGTGVSLVEQKAKSRVIRFYAWLAAGVLFIALGVAL